MNSINSDIIRSILDELQIATTLDEDGDLRLCLSADENFPYDVVIYVMVNNNQLSFAAGAMDYTPAADLYHLANKHNCNNILPVAVVRDGNIRMECSFLLDEEVSKEYIVNNCIRLPISQIWKAFCDIEKEQSLMVK